MDAKVDTAPDQTVCHLVRIMPVHLSKVWPQIADQVASIVERSRGRETADTLLLGVADDRIQLWLVWDGTIKASVWTELGFAATGIKICTIRACVGADSAKWLHLLDEIEDWARDSEGCALIETLARKGWEKKLPDYKMTHTFLEKAL